MSPAAKGLEGYQPKLSRGFGRKYQKTRKFLPVTDVVIENHLLGNGNRWMYPLLPDETFWFLAADLDKKTWEYDSLAFLETCQELNVPAALERSRSGKGGHICIFFDRALPAISARKLACVLLTRTMKRRGRPVARTSGAKQNSSRLPICSRRRQHVLQNIQGKTMLDEWCSPCRYSELPIGWCCKTGCSHGAHRNCTRIPSASSSPAAHPSPSIVRAPGAYASRRTSRFWQ